jgi:hypothetical protein
MTPKKNWALLPPRTPAFVDRKIGAAELQISEATWDRYVERGIIPPPAPGLPPDTPRWRWADVDAKLSGQINSGTQKNILEAARRLK